MLYYIHQTPLSSWRVEGESGFETNPPPSDILLFLFLQTGEELIDGNHYASHEIEARIETLNAHWQNLSEK